MVLRSPEFEFPHDDRLYSGYRLDESADGHHTGISGVDWGQALNVGNRKLYKEPEGDQPPPFGFARSCFYVHRREFRALLE